METRANYTLVGSLCLLILVSFCVFAVWLANVQFNRTYQDFDILFDGPVRGLSEGGEVRFNGIKVGEVTQVMLDPGDPRKVIAKARLSAGVPIKQDSYATLEPQGLTGVNYVQITAGTRASPALTVGLRHGQLPVIATRRSTLDDIVQDGGSLMADAVAALQRVNRALSDDNIAAFTAVLGDARDIASELRSHKAMIADAHSAVRHADAAAVGLLSLETAGQRLVEVDASRTVRQVGVAAGDVGAAAKAAQDVAARLDRPAADFAATGLPQITAAAVDLQRTSEALTRLLSDVQADPRGALDKPPTRDLEVPR
jgi:phospholipid/cholesterol/gamma-HCH transport system substrate-binding protein